MRRSKVVHEGWMVRYGRRKIGRSYIHMRYFVLESRLLAYYKKKPLDGVVPVKTLLIDGNCRVEDQGVKTHHAHNVYVLSVYSKKDTSNRMTDDPSIEDHLEKKSSLRIISNVMLMFWTSVLALQSSRQSAYNIQEALLWKDKIESIIDQHQGSHVTNGNKYHSFEYRYGMTSSSDHDTHAAEDEDDYRPNSPHRTIGNGPPESVLDWTNEFDSNLPNHNYNSQAFSRKYWRLLQCQNGLRIFEEPLEVDFLPKSCSRAMKAVGVVEATCEETFELIMRMDATRCDWDCSFQYGSLVEEVDGHTAILYQRLQLDWFSMFVWPRDLCYVRYWRRNDDGSYVVLFRSRDHESCGRQPGYVRAHIESGGFNISPLKPRGGRPRTKVQHLMQIDLKGWGVSYFSSFQQHCLLQILNSVAGLREYFSQTDERTIAPRMPLMVNMTSASDSSKRGKKLQSTSFRYPSSSNRNSVAMDDSDDDDDFQYADEEASPFEIEDKKIASEEEPDQLDMTMFWGNLRRDDQDNARDCWTLSDGNNFRVRSKSFCHDKSKIPGGKHLMDLVAVDWFKYIKRMDHVAKRSGCAAQVAADRGHFSIVINLQVPGSTHYSMIFYFVIKELVRGSLLQQFVDGDDEFRNSRLKLIPSVPKGSWIVRQSVGSTPCILGKSVDCNYIRGPSYLEIDVDIGSSTVANGVLGLVIGVITTLVVDMAFIVQASSPEELPERLIGAVRVCHLELSSATEPNLEADP